MDNNITMVYDKIDNIAIYKSLSPNIAMGLDFLKQMRPDTAVGVYQINQHVKAIVSEYETKPNNEYGYEAHRKNIDIQYLLSGEECIACLSIDRLKETKLYNADSDAAFYEATDMQPQEMIIGDGYFAVFFPQDGHMPQLCLGEPEMVKKVVVKVEVTETK